jgi:hypothetical protein
VSESLLADRIARSWDATSESYCDLGQTFLLCEQTAEMACNGLCPVHGGDACLFVYGKVLLLDASRNQAIRDALPVIEHGDPKRCTCPQAGWNPFCPQHGQTAGGELRDA